MPNPKIYENELQIFRTKYNMEKTYDLNNLLKIDQKFQYVKAFLGQGEVENNPAVQYTNLLRRTCMRILKRIRS